MICLEGKEPSHLSGPYYCISYFAVLGVAKLSDEAIKKFFGQYGSIATVEQPFDKVKNEWKSASHSTLTQSIPYRYDIIFLFSSLFYFDSNATILMRN